MTIMHPALSTDPLIREEWEREHDLDGNLLPRDTRVDLPLFPDDEALLAELESAVTRKLLHRVRWRLQLLRHACDLNTERAGASK